MIIVLNITIGLHKSKFNAINAIMLEFMFTFIRQLTNEFLYCFVEFYITTIFKYHGYLYSISETIENVL